TETQRRSRYALCFTQRRKQPAPVNSGFLSGCISGQPTCRIGYLEVIATCFGIYVNNFTCKVQSFHHLRFHSLWIYFFRRNATGSHNGLFESAVPENFKLQVLKQIPYLFSFGG